MAKDQIKAAQARMAELTVWIQQNITSPEWMQKVSERNHISVKLEIMRQQRNGAWKYPYTTPIGIIPLANK